MSTFSDTDISMAELEFCDFEGKNAFDIKYFTGASLTDLVYHDGLHATRFSTQPILVFQGNTRIIILEKSIIFNGKTHTFGEDKHTESMEKHPTQITQS